MQSLLNLDSNDPKSRLHKVSDAVSLTGRQSIIATDWLLEHEIYALHIVFGMTPVPDCIQIAELEAV
jgi:hypothetical protein